MQIEAVYYQGQLQFPVPLRFKRERFSLVVEIPDQEIIARPHHTVTPSDSIAHRLDALIGKAFRQSNQGKPSVNAKALWHEHLEEKYLGR